MFQFQQHSKKDHKILLILKPQKSICVTLIDLSLEYNFEPSTFKYQQENHPNRRMISKH
jgi:hypothetical protein